MSVNKSIGIEKEEKQKKVGEKEETKGVRDSQMNTMAGYKAYNQQEREKAAKLGPESEKAYLRN